MKAITLVLFVLITHVSTAQQKIPLTDTLTISGNLVKEVKYTSSDLAKLTSVNIGDIAIKNHLGETRRTARNLKGIQVKQLLEGSKINIENHRLLSEFYFLFIASDNYSAVFSWNEIFNTETGNNIYIITEEDGKPMAQMDDRISLLVKTDIHTGRRHIKGLKKIIVKRAEL